MVLAVLGFFVWKKRQDDDDDSDDDDGRFNPPPKVNYNQSATSTAFAAGATNYSKPPPPYPGPPAQQGHMVTSPRQHNTYAMPVAGPITAYDSPSAVDNSQRGFQMPPPSQQYPDRLSDHSAASSEGSRDVWGNTVGGSSFREKRTASNVSVEF